MFTIKAKIIFAYTVAFGVMIAAFGIVIYQYLHDAEVAKVDARLESHADKIQTELEEDHLQPGFPALSEIQSVQTEGLSGVKIRLLTRDRNVVFADSGFTLDARMDWNSGPDSTTQKVTTRLGRHKYRILQWPVDIDGRVLYLVQVAAPMREIQENLDRLILLFVIVIPVGLLIAGCVAFFITSMAFKPLMKMVGTAETISASRLDARLEVPKRRDEVQVLGKALNEMIGRIDDAVKSQRQFIADASHELRTPMTIMRTELENAERLSRRSTVKESIVSSIAELDHLSSMVNDLLTLARLDAAQMALETSTIRLDELLVECVQAVSGIAKKKSVKIKVFVEDAVEIAGDAAKLKSVLLNLLDNAIKYSSKNKEVSASLVLKEGRAGMVSIVIRDSGPGIPQAEQQNIFRRFYRGPQSRSETNGSGLGLAIAQRFVDLHCGHIGLESKEGVGSAFTVELPLPPVDQVIHGNQTH